MSTPVQQEWVCALPLMQQSVLFAAIRGPDGVRKGHPVKPILRWYRRSILLSAFDRRALDNPFEEGGGSFTGPFTIRDASSVLGHKVPNNPANPQVKKAMRHAFGHLPDVYLTLVDELPHHFQLHFMHASQIVGVHHPVKDVREWWWRFYLAVVNDAHLHPETPEEMNLRLSDNPEAWKAREKVRTDG